MAVVVDKPARGDKAMKLKDLLKKFGGGACVSVYDVFGNYCREASYDYYDLPKWARSRAGLQEFLSDDNPNHYRSTCITVVWVCLECTVGGREM